MLKRVLVGSAIAAGSWYAFYRATTWRARWGVEPDEVRGELAGDDLVQAPTVVDTRSINLSTTPDAVWPWLVQMGFGRGGWYSYDALDMKGSSADRIIEELQEIGVGDTIPTDPGGGFEVRVVEPRRALVLFADSDIMARRVEATNDKATGAGLAASGKFMETSMPTQFAASWAFVLKPDERGGTMLTERLRVSFGDHTPASKLMGPVLGTGVFLMMRKQMLGIRDRAEGGVVGAGAS